MKLTVAILLLSLLAGCDHSDQTTPTPLTQQQRFCAAVDKFRSAYKATSDRAKYLDQEHDLANIFAARNASLQAILGDGQINGWAGKVDSLIASPRGAYLKVDLGCEALLVPTDSQVVLRGSAAFEQLRALHEGGSVTVTGHLVRGTAENVRFVRGGFEEGSITDGGSMRQPEMVFVVTGAQP
jgi:hypothetical protein